MTLFIPGSADIPPELLDIAAKKNAVIYYGAGNDREVRICNLRFLIQHCKLHNLPMIVEVTPKKLDVTIKYLAKDRFVATVLLYLVDPDGLMRYVKTVGAQIRWYDIITGDRYTTDLDDPRFDEDWEEE